MVDAVIAGVRVGEDGEVAPVQDEPLRDIAELCCGHGQLAASTGMRPHGAQMIMTFGDAEFRVRRSPERPRLLDLVGVEIDVRVEVVDHAARMHLDVEGVEKGVDCGNSFRLVELRCVANTGNSRQHHVGGNLTHSIRRCGGQ